MADLRDRDPLARFITNKKGFAKSTGRINARALLPQERALSVYQIGQLSESEIWELGRANIVESEGRRVRARGDFTVGAVIEVGLEVDPDDVPPRHANVVGWPDDKSERLERAKDLAKKSVLKLP